MAKTSPEETKTETTQQNRLPTLTLDLNRFKIKSVNQILVLLLVVASFLIGVLFTKVQHLEKGVTTPSNNQAQQAPQITQAPAVTDADIKNWAKEIGLNTNEFNSCYDSNEHESLITQDTTDGTTVGVSGTPSFLINGTLLVGAQPFATFKEAIDKEINGTADAADKKEVGNGHLPVKGNANAAVTIVEFADFECPFCKNFYRDTLPQIQKEYIDTGKAALYYRHLPLEFHPLAKPFANAAECAHVQDKFWEMHDKIFESQG